jgi:hypothetical protein
MRTVIKRKVISSPHYGLPQLKSVRRDRFGEAVTTSLKTQIELTAKIVDIVIHGNDRED